MSFSFIPSLLFLLSTYSFLFPNLSQILSSLHQAILHLPTSAASHTFPPHPNTHHLTPQHTVTHSHTSPTLPQVYKRAAAQHKRQNFVMSPLNLISTLGMLLLGARGPSAGVLRDLMQMDKFYTFNPHLVLKNVTAAMLGLKDVHDITFFSQFLVDMVRGLVFVIRGAREQGKHSEVFF